MPKTGSPSNAQIETNRILQESSQYLLGLDDTTLGRLFKLYLEGNDDIDYEGMDLQDLNTLARWHEDMVTAHKAGILD
jgi:hypothetical protein